MTYSGGSREVVRSHGIASPFGLVVYGSNVYWVDRSLKQVLMTSKQPNNRSLVATVIRSSMEDLQEVAMFDESMQPSGDGN